MAALANGTPCRMDQGACCFELAAHAQQLACGCFPLSHHVQHQSCNEVCEARGMTCNAKDFWWLNSCAGRSGRGHAAVACTACTVKGNSPSSQPSMPLLALRASAGSTFSSGLQTSCLRITPSAPPPPSSTPAVMRKHFPCEHGCIIELGPDVPAYVVDPSQTLFHYCLLTQVGWLGPMTCGMQQP